MNNYEQSKRAIEFNLEDNLVNSLSGQILSHDYARENYVCILSKVLMEVDFFLRNGGY